MHRTRALLAIAWLTVTFSGGLPIRAAETVEASRTDVKKKKPQSVADKLAKMKPGIKVKSVDKPNTAPILLYTVDGKTLDGKPAAICDIRNCRIAILGVDISATRKRVTRLNVRVAGKESEKQVIKSAKGKIFFVSSYESKKQSKKAQCRFHDFEFELNNVLLSYGAPNKRGFRTNGTLWNNSSNAGVLILVDAATGKYTTHGMRPKSRRVLLKGSKKPKEKRR